MLNQVLFFQEKIIELTTTFELEIVFVLYKLKLASFFFCKVVENLALEECPERILK